MKLSLPAAISLTGWSERTFWRRFADGSLRRETVDGKSVLEFAELLPHLCVPLEALDVALLARADAGEAAAQHELALVFLAQGRAKGAVYWLELAAKQDWPDAAHLLSQCFLQGNGLEQNANKGMVWLAKAAELGHVIAARQMRGIYGGEG